MSKITHCCIDLDYIVHRGGARQLAGGISRDGRLMSEAEIMGEAAVLKARGFDAMPTCANHDERGYCRGCESESLPR